MKDIVIYGASGFGREVATLIGRISSNSNEKWNIIGYIDDGIKVGTEISHFGKVLGGINYLNDYHDRLAVVIAIGNPHVKLHLITNIHNPNIYYPNIISPDFVIQDSVTLKMGKGNLIQGGCVTTCNVSIGDFNLLNGSVVLAHDVVVGNYNVFMPNVKVSGEVNIGNCNLIGVGSIILQQLKIGNETVIGAGAVLMTSPKEGNTYIGNPAKIFKY